MTTALPALLGDFQLDRLLGSGASARVHLARRRQDGMWVALKVLAPNPAWRERERTAMRTRFLTEADITMRLRHPDIVTVHAAGEDQGLLWLAMELVQGGSLERHVTRQRLLPPPVALRIVVRVARALAHAHAHGVVHRDIKPSNVLLELPAQVVKLGDFGTARLLDTRQTGTEVLLGTPVYMAPELLAGSAANAASDLYALGVVLFEMLTGRRPHESASMGELLRQVAAEPAPDVRELCPSLPADLASIVSALLAKTAARRPDNSSVAADCLAAVLKHWPVPAAADTDTAAH